MDAACSSGDKSTRCTFSISAISNCSNSLAVRTIAGPPSSPATCAARQRRSPAMSWKRFPIGRTTSRPARRSWSVRSARGVLLLPQGRRSVSISRFRAQDASAILRRARCLICRFETCDAAAITRTWHPAFQTQHMIQACCKTLATACVSGTQLFSSSASCLRPTGVRL